MNCENDVWFYMYGKTYGSFTQYSDGAIWEPHHH